MKTALVSGAGSGIGREVSLALSQAEYKIILIGRRKEALVETQSLMTNKSEHITLAVDISDQLALQESLSRINLTQMNLCAVIANAGIAGENNYGKEDRWDEIIKTNLTGTYYLVNEVLNGLKNSTQEYKHVVMISSILAKLGVPGYSAYCASKAGLLGLMRSWAAEWAMDKILVNAICPGWVETEMARSGIEKIAKATSKSYGEILKQQMAMTPLKKMSRPEEIANLIQYLISEKQNSITGQSIDINNGAGMY